MSTDISTYQPLPEEIQKICDEYKFTLRVGQIFFYNRDVIIRIREINERLVYFDCGSGNFENLQWSSYGSREVEAFLKNLNEEFVFVDKPIHEIMKEAEKVISGEIPLSVYSDDGYGEINTETAIIGKTTKDGLVAITKDLEEKKNRALIMQKAVSVMVENKKRQLQKVVSDMQGSVAEFRKKISKIERVINTIELYLGIDEEIHQIKFGENAPQEEPIHFRQKVLYIDEEVGIHEDGGLDFRDIDKFDEWLLIPKNLDIVLPEKKGIVVFNPRRNKKQYGDPFLGVFYNQANLLDTYVLIRNGENLYRIYTDKIVITKRLFPLRAEMQKLVERLEEATYDGDIEKIENEMYQYKNRAMLLQGLIDRTDIFKPYPVERINVFKLDEHENLVKFIYDDEAALPTGRKSFNDWWKDANEKITEGSRVLITGKYPYGERYSRRSDYADRFYTGKNSHEGELLNVPDLPKEGIYEVEYFTPSVSHKYRETEYNEKIKELQEKNIKFQTEIVKGRVWQMPDSITGSKKIYRITRFEENTDLTIMYKPNAPTSSGWNRYDEKERSNRTRFKIEKDDSFVINYDQISIEDIDFYLESRVDRHNYLEMMPILKKLKAFLIQEAKNEQPFIRLVRDMAIPKMKKLTEQEIEERVVDSVGWWKFKNKWKRAVSSDDSRALRMILQRVTSKNYKPFSEEDSE